MGGPGVALRDDLGRDVRLSAPARRIASLSPALTEIVCAVGCLSSLVLRDRWSDFPPEAHPIPAVDAISPSAEQILAARPDLVLVSFPNARVRAALDAAGVPWLALSPADLPAIKRDIDQVARACGATEDGQAAQRAFAASLAAAASARPQGERRPRVYLELDVAGAKAWTTGGDAFTSALVAAAGGDNVFANLRGWPQIGTEAIVAADPDVVLLAWPAAGPAGGSSQLGNVPAGRTGVMADAQSAARAFAARPGLLGLRAVRMGRIHRLDPALLGRPGPRAPAAVAAIAAVLSSPPAAALETP